MSYHDLTADFNRQLHHYREILQRFDEAHHDLAPTNPQRILPKVWRSFAEALMLADTEQKASTHIIQNPEAAKFCLTRAANTTDVSMPEYSLDDYEKVMHRPFYLVAYVALKLVD